MVCFESVQHPGQHLGIFNDGSLKQAAATGRGDHGRFHIILDNPVSKPEVLRSILQAQMLLPALYVRIKALPSIKLPST